MDVFTEEQRSKLMSRIKSKNTNLEMLVRKLLHALGYRFRLQRKDLPGTPDIVLPKYRTVIFTHGCLWHGHDCPRGHKPTSNVAFWEKKIAGNMERDRKAQQALRDAGWTVLVVWQCQTKDVTTLTSILQSIKDRAKT